MIKLLFKAALILCAVVTLTGPSTAWGATGEKVIRYKGEADTDTSMEIRISPNGKTYVAKFKSGKIEYKCQRGTVSSEGEFEEVECGQIRDEDPNKDPEDQSNPLIFVEGDLEIMERRAWADGGSGRGNALEFTRIKETIADLKRKAEAKRRAEEAERKRQQAIAKAKRKAEAERKRKLAAAKAKRKAEAKRRAEEAERKRKLAAAKAKRKAEAERKRKLAAVKAKRKAEAERKRKLAAVKAKRKAEAKRRALFKIKNANAAGKFLKDLRNFARLNPKVFDMLTIAKLYGPALQEIKKGSFGQKGSNFSKLLKLVRVNSQFTAYRKKQLLERQLAKAKQEKIKKLALEKRKSKSLQILRRNLKTLKSRVLADPFAANASAIAILIENYKNVSKKETVVTLERSVAQLTASMTKLGIITPEAKAERKQKPSKGKKTLTVKSTAFQKKIAAAKDTIKYSDLVRIDGLLRKKSTNVPFTGQVTGKAKGQLKDGTEDGLWVVYWENGQLWDKITYKNGKKHGPYVSYRKNGQLESKGTFKDGKLNGPNVSYHENGRIFSKGTFKNGKEDGLWFFYQENGQLFEKITVKDGKEDGPYVSYHDNGKVSEKGTYKNGKEHGPWVSYHDNGKVRDKTTYKNGKKQIQAVEKREDTKKSAENRAAAKRAADYQKGRDAYYKEDHATALRVFKPLAEQGNADAQNSLGWMYREGIGVPQNNKEAVKWYRLAAEQGHASARYNLGRAYFKGEGVSLDNKLALKWLELAAKNSKVRKRANKLVSEIQRLENLKTAGRDAEKIARIFKNKFFTDHDIVAAAKREADALYNLGLKYAYGQGVPQNNKEAVKWYRLAAEQGHAKAQNNLGYMYREGRGVPQNDKTAMKWWKLAAEQGHADAQNSLGWMYREGIGVPQNDKTAMKWWKLAAEQGHADAQNNLGSMYAEGQGVVQDYKKAVWWYRKSAEQRYAPAQNNLGLTYAYGQGVPQNNKEAVKWYRLAAEQGHASARYNLGYMYREGRGVPKDYIRAHMWFNIAAAGRARDTIAKRMTPADISAAQKLARECLARKFKGC